MPSERLQRQIDRLLDEAEQALADDDWPTVEARARKILAIDPTNDDAREFLETAERAAPSSAVQGLPSGLIAQAGFVAEPIASTPTSFAAGRYTVKRFLGEGGKKRVFLAHDTLLDCDVAFALIKMEGLDQAGRDRIKREAQSMGRLGAHPHIVSVFDLGEEPPPLVGGEDTVAGPREYELLRQPFIVTELMGGGDVEGLIEKTPEHRPPLERSLEICIQVCRGLEFAHSHGIVHRDLKPGNVWLTADGTAKIGDFGLAVALDKSRLTQAGMMVGTVSYMPPEQATGGEVTPRSDLYSLGAMLYELVTGRPPFIGDESVAIITQHLNSAPVSPSWHNHSVPAALELLILRLLEKDPNRRPASAVEVRDTLAAIRSKDAPRIDAAGTDGAPPTPERDPIYRRSFVGREAELRDLQTAYDSAVSGRGALAMVVGEPGIGKTSLCEQLSTYTTIRGGKTLVGHSYEEGSLSLPYLPFVEALRSYVLGREADDLRKELGTMAGDVARIVSEIRDRLPIELMPAGSPEDDRWRLLQAVTGFLRNAAAVQPLVLILEDLHDADSGTLDMLLHLSRNLEGARLLVIGTYRDVEVDRAHPLSSTLAELRRGGNFVRVPLRGLTAEEVQRMMAAVAQREISWPFAELVHRQTEGNPLFVQEMLRYLVEEGLVADREGALRRVGDETLVGRIPEGLRDVIGKRLSRLSDETNQVLSIAAVIGREFRLEVLQRVADLPDEQVEQALEQAAGVAVVEQRQVTGALAFRFTHAFFRQTLYEEIFVPRRIRLHQRLARALVSVYGRRVDEHAAELAEHFAQTTDREDLEQALHYSRVAADRAMAVYAYGEAEGHLNQALKVQEVLDPDDARMRCDLLLALGEAILPGEEPGRAAMRAAPEAFALAETLHDGDRAARASILALDSINRENASPETYHSEAFRIWTDRAERTVREGTRERIYADVYLGLWYLFETGPASAHPYFRRAVRAALAPNEDDTLAMAAGWALRHLQAVQDVQTIDELADELLKRPRARARAGDEGVCLLYLGHVLLSRGDRPGAEAAWRDLTELAARTRDGTVRLMARAPKLTIALLDGRLEDMLALDAELRGLGRELGTDTNLASFGAGASRGAMYLGQSETVLEAIGSPNNRPLLAVRAACLAHLGRHDEARAIRDRFGDIGSDQDESSAGILALLLEAAVLGADVETARVVAERLAPMKDQALVGFTGAFCPTLLGRAEALIGNPHEARSHYERGLQIAAKVASRPDTALTRLALAELLLDHYPDERASAIEHLDFAIGEFREMKMQPSLERALRHKEVLKA